jgi:ATP-dependent Clp protease ATP-binding subunit ClpA
MFERYTERARRVIFFGRYEASNFGSSTIESEHLLLGLLREDVNLINRFLRDSGSSESIRKEIEGRTSIREKISTSIDLPLSSDCKRILACANEEAERLNHRHIGTEHLLLGILREERCMAAQILHDRGLRLVAIREELARSLPSAEGTEGEPPAISSGFQNLSQFERYTERARRVIFFARYEASQFGSKIIETEHLLLGLIREDKNLTNRFLRNSSSIESIRKEIEGRVTVREKIPPSIGLPLSQECQRILVYANDEAERLNHRHIGTEHLLLGILREERCMAAQILHDRGLRLVAIREELARSLPGEGMLGVRLPAFSPTYQTLVLRLDAIDLATAKEHFGLAAKALFALQFEIAQIELQHVLDSIEEALKQRTPKEEVFAPVCRGLDWPISLKDVHTGLSAEEDCKFKFNLTLLLAELLLLRYSGR